MPLLPRLPSPPAAQPRFFLFTCLHLENSFPTDNRTLIQEEASNQPEQPTPPLPFLQLTPTTPSSLCRPLPTLLSHCVLTNPNNRSMRVITIPSMLNGKRVLETFRGSPKLRHNSSGPLLGLPDPRQFPPPPPTWQCKSSGPGETQM